MIKKNSHIIKNFAAIGLVIIIINFVYENFFLKGNSLPINLYLKLIAGFLLYVASLLYLISNKKNPLKTGFAYVKESSKYIWSAIFIFALSAIFGLIFREKLTFIDEIIKNLIQQTNELNTPELITFILINNSNSSIFSIFVGSFFGILPIISSLFNGLILGYVLGRTAEITSILDWWRLLPHGIFELPAIFISFGLGIKLGFTLFLPKKPRAKKFFKYLSNSFITLITIIIPLLIIAAIIEGIAINFLP